MTKRIRVAVTGIVQGVGFRPFLHRLARRFELAGWARNTSAGVELEIEGGEGGLAAFVAALQDPAALPPLAVVEQVACEPLPRPLGQAGFRILESRGGAHDTLVSPDVATCPDCLRELFDPADRRYRYPFINCTNCGPRFTIVKTVPYDRANTTMGSFAMCPACAAEYRQITDRRYHAQPDCCPACGPSVTFCDGAGRPAAGDPFAAAQALLRAGGILAVKGLGGFHLACTVESPAPALRLRRRKRRDSRPLAVMCPDLAAARRLCRVSGAEAALLESIRRPIVLLAKRRRDSLAALSKNGVLGVLLPYTPLHQLLFAPPAGQEGAPPVFGALVMTSANLAGQPAVIENEAALRQLAGVADGYLLHDRQIEARCDDSLVRAVGGRAYFIRRSRGYAPQPLALPFDCSGLLALGAEQKASFAFGKGRRAFYSQHIGDLKNRETLEHYETQLERFRQLFGVQERALACDLHPDFLSTRYAKGRAAERGLRLVQVQHHHAHFASCMADNGLAGDCIGVVWDGFGLGEDGAAWGGEFLVGGYAAVRRAAALRPVLLAGGDAAVEEPGRVALALLADAGLLPPQAGPAGPLQRAAQQALAGMEPGRRRFLAAMLQRGVQCVPSSGMGRLFDGVYSLLTGQQRAGYEGEGAVQLEALAARHPAWRAGPCGDGAGRFEIRFYQEPQGGPLRFDTRPLVTGLLQGLAEGEKPAALAARFHATLIEMAARLCLRLRAETGLDRVLLSGGVFFNMLLLRGLTARLGQLGFSVYSHRQVSCGDEGVALGQMAVARARLEDEGQR